MNLKTIFILTVTALAAIVSHAENPRTRVVAHRGYWNTPGSAQNSIRALIKADSIGCYASEFDVWMTLDSVLVVNHDATINGLVIEDTPAAEILKQKLSNGENVPTLEQYLDAAEKLNIRLVLELKEHDSRRRELAAAKKAVNAIKEHGLDSRTDYITFSKEAFEDFIRLTPKGTRVYNLDGKYVPSQVKHLGGAGIDYSLRTIKLHPEWIPQCHDMGLEVNIWTVNSPEDMQWCIDRGADYITTNNPEKLQQILAGQAK